MAKHPKSHNLRDTEGRVGKTGGYATGVVKGGQTGKDAGKYDQNSKLTGNGPHPKGM